ncbi:MAG: hypothetical protein CVV61_02300 [Tenericutes bacterium HGW-Tenericutes-6]|nr:MAG: hypothetical protein CVV61_02300 [Tenericutes bacterium HGW-Tenericutes-6]
MSIVLWVIFFLFAVISFVPVIRLEQVKSNPKYRILWYLSISVFSWSIFTGLKMIVSEPFFIYYFTLITYPIIFVISYYIYYTLSIYMGRHIRGWFHLFAAIFFVANVIISMTNPLHFLMIKIPLSDTITLDSFALVERGIFFMIHSVICYLLLLTGFVQVLIYLYKKSKERKENIFPFHLILFSVILGISVNLIHLYVYHFTLDPTYLFVVSVTFALYTIIYKRDFNINLLSTSKQFLLQRLREMYIISNHDGDIVELSQNLIQRFQINPEQFTHINQFFNYLSEKAIIFEDFNALKNDIFNDQKIYLNMHQESFKIKKSKAKGLMTLLYDETRHMKLLHEIDYMRTHDLMTSLYNRNYFESRLNEYEKMFESVGIILIDVDGLKQHNDILGHHSGDQLIIRFSHILKKLNLVYKDTLIFRFGGDEFIIICPNAAQEQLRLMVHFIKERTENKDPIKHISFSYGYAVREKNNISIVDLIKESDIKLYERKSNKTDEKEMLKEALIKESHSNQV